MVPCQLVVCSVEGESHQSKSFKISTRKDCLQIVLVKLQIILVKLQIIFDEIANCFGETANCFGEITN